MRYACVLNGARSFNAFLDLVCEAEAAGWDGFFLPDGLAIKGIQLFDPWVMMGAIAARTSRIRFGAMITPVSRRRPWKLAKECATVDHLSKGRLIFAAGLGAWPDDEGFGRVGEAVDIKVRAQRLDEGLEIMDGLWKGKPYSFSGEHFKVDKMTMKSTAAAKAAHPDLGRRCLGKAEVHAARTDMGWHHSATIQRPAPVFTGRHSQNRRVRRTEPPRRQKANRYCRRWIDRT